MTDIRIAKADLQQLDKGTAVLQAAAKDFLSDFGGIETALTRIADTVDQALSAIDKVSSALGGPAVPESAKKVVSGATSALKTVAPAAAALAAIPGGQIPAAVLAIGATVTGAALTVGDEERKEVVAQLTKRGQARLKKGLERAGRVDRKRDDKVEATLRRLRRGR